MAKIDIKIKNTPTKNIANQKIFNIKNALAVSIFLIAMLLVIFYRFPSLTFNSDLNYYTEYFQQNLSKENALLSDIREGLAFGKKVNALDKYHFDFNPDYSQVYITLFQRGSKPLRFGSKRSTLSDTIDRAVFKLRQRSGFKKFDIADADKCRILFEIVQSEKRIQLADIDYGRFTKTRFEPGINGLKFNHANKTYYFMPTDASVFSHLTLKQVLNEMAKRIGLGKFTNKISGRIERLMQLDIECFLLTSKAFVTYGNDILPLYRGYPAPMEFSKKNIRKTLKTSVDWMLANMNRDGSFLYYYDGVKDTIKDHEHSQKRTLDNLYYNILRHSGGTITLLKMYDFTKDKKYLNAAKSSLDYLIKKLHLQDADGQKAYYVYYNEKSKLGGTGIALTAFVQYYMASKDKSYHPYMEGMVRHLLSRIEPDGEMIGYYIHPGFNDGKPIINPSPENKKALFSFYYPGEALLGLALYEREIDLAPEFRKKIRRLSKLALDFLVDIRPTRYKDLFTSLPADGWLMQAIEEWSYDKDFQRKAYLDFVYNDARAMMEHMYNYGNSKFYDYPGSFFYNYGDVSYPDGARSEGLIAAYYLARRMGQTKLAEKILKSCKLAATSLLYTYNSKASTFMHKYPEKSTGAFRFKYTRQWVRVDSVQHTACFYKRLYNALNRSF
jgi:hypothetical protein